MKNVNSIYIYAQSEGWELLSYADDNTSVWTRSLSGFMLHKFCICSISSIIGPLFSFLLFFWNPPSPTHTHTLLHINCLTIIIESPKLSQISDQKCHFPKIFQTWKRALQFSQTFQKNVTDHAKSAYHSWEIPHTSHGAGQTRPVNSGKLLVWCRLSRASFHLCYGDKHTGLTVSRMTHAWWCWGRLKHADDMVQTHTWQHGQNMQ